MNSITQGVYSLLVGDDAPATNLPPPLQPHSTAASTTATPALVPTPAPTGCMFAAKTWAIFAGMQNEADLVACLQEATPILKAATKPPKTLSMIWLHAGSPPSRSLKDAFTAAAKQQNAKDENLTEYTIAEGEMSQISASASSATQFLALSGDLKRAIEMTTRAPCMLFATECSRVYATMRPEVNTNAEETLAEKGYSQLLATLEGIVNSKQLANTKVFGTMLGVYPAEPRHSEEPQLMRLVCWRTANCEIKLYTAVSEDFAQWAAPNPVTRRATASPMFTTVSLIDVGEAIKPSFDKLPPLDQRNMEDEHGPRAWKPPEGEGGVKARLVVYAADTDNLYGRSVKIEQSKLVFVETMCD